VVGLGLCVFFAGYFLVAQAGMHGGSGHDVEAFVFWLLNAIYGYAWLITIATWHAANKYQGHKIWPILSKLCLILFGLYLTFIVAIFNIDGFSDLVSAFIDNN
jgi:hypothetical protein